MSDRPGNAQHPNSVPAQSGQSADLRVLQLENEALKTHITSLLYEKSELVDAVASYRQSTSWKLTAPIRALRRGLFWLIGAPQDPTDFQASGVVQRRGAAALRYELVAVKDLLRDGTGNWIATGVDPQLEVRLVGGTLRRGWYRLTLQAETPAVARRLSPVWYRDQPDSQDGATQGVLARDGLKFSATFFSSNAVAGLRIDPCFFRCIHWCFR